MKIIAFFSAIALSFGAVAWFASFSADAAVVFGLFVAAAWVIMTTTLANRGFFDRS